MAKIKRCNLFPNSVAAGYHQQRLRELVGLETEELQAKRLLASFERFRTRLGKDRPSDDLVAQRWLKEIFEPNLAKVPAELRGRVEPAQLFHEMLEHRWYLNEKAGYDVGLRFRRRFLHPRCFAISSRFWG
jgi:hypothetical protein